MRVVIIFSIIFAFILIGIMAMLVLLTKSLSKSLYYYRNAAYIAGILFYILLLLALYVYLMSCLLNTKTLTMKYLLDELIYFPREFAIFALPVFSIISILLFISNVALIRHEGLRFKNLLGVLMGLMFIGGTSGIWSLERAFKPIVFSEAQQFVFTFLGLFFWIMMCYFECFFIGTVSMAYLAAKQHPKYDKDFIIILGCAIDKKGGLLPLLRARTNQAIHYAWEQEIASGKPVLYVPSGGKGTDEIMSEGSAMELYLLSHGAEANEIYPEKESTNTYENFLYSKRIIDGIKPEAKIAFVTTNYHMFRSGLLARKNGIWAEGISSKTKWYFWPNGFIREFIALLVMKKKQHFIVIGTLAMICMVISLMSVL